jgi:hypothetical protein
VILGGCDRLVTGELVPRRSRREARTVEMLSLLALAGGVAPAGPDEALPPATIVFEPTELEPWREPCLCG